MTSNEKITAENCKTLLVAYMEKENIPSQRIAKSFGCSHATLTRVLLGLSVPTKEFQLETGILIEIGISRYESLSKAEKKRIYEAVGAITGGAIGFASIQTAIASSGVVVGLSSAGIASGLATIGSGSVLGGVLSVAFYPIAAGLVGFAMVKGIKHLWNESERNSGDVDLKWEKEITM